jgi:hypothetical protein
MESTRLFGRAEVDLHALERPAEANRGPLGLRAGPTNHISKHPPGIGSMLESSVTWSGIPCSTGLICSDEYYCQAHN